jgi:hypothetical protein
MPTPRPWTVLPHDPIIRHEANLWSVEGSVGPKNPLRRRMTLVKLADGGLLIHNGQALEEPDMKAIEAWGEPRILIVPNGFHRMDAHAFKQRYPKLRVLCPATEDAQVRQVVQVGGHYDSLPQDPSVSVETLEGLKVGEGVLIVRSGERVSLIFNDVLFNMEHQTGFTGFVLRYITASTGGLKASRIGSLFLIKDRQALRAHLERLAALPGLYRLIIMHGNIIEGDAAARLRAAAQAL